MESAQLDLAFGALADPTRRELLRRIGQGARPVVELCADLPISQPAVSKHLRVLREAGLVRSAKRGREQLYQLADGGIADLRAYVESISAMWDEALAAFATYVERE